MDWWRLDLNGLKVLHALLIERAVTRAAARLHLTPSAVSHRLRDLREAFGDPLFLRTPRGMEPTQRMRDIGIALAAVVASLEAATASAFVPSEAQTVFRLVATESVSLTLLPALTALLRREAPGCGLHVSLFERRDYTSDLLNGVADLVLSVGGHTPASAGIGIEHLLEDDLTVLIGPASAAWDQTALNEADYLALGHVYSLPWPTDANHLDQILARDHRNRRIHLVVPHHAVAVDVVASTDLVLTLPSRAARRLIEDRPDLRGLPCPFSGAGQVSLEWATDRARTGRVRFLREALINTAILVRD